MSRLHGFAACGRPGRWCRAGRVPEASGNKADQSARTAEPIPGGVTAKISGIAAEQGLHPVCGLQNPSEILPMTLPSWSHRAGKISTYRKTHLTTAERSWASAGDAQAVIDTPFGGRVGLLIGRDVSFPEAGRLRGCDLMSCRDVPPIPIGGDPHPWRHFHVRGGENKILRIRERVRCRELLLSISTPAISASSIRERRQAKGSRLYAHAARVWCNRNRATSDDARAICSKMGGKRRVRGPRVGCDGAIHNSAQPSQKVLARDAAPHYLTTTPAGHH